MQKIPTIFERDWNGDRSRVIDKPHPDCGWVFAGEGVATRKLDGTCCMVRAGKLFRRRELKPGSVVPVEFEGVGLDETTGKTVGWIPVSGDDPTDKWHRAAFWSASENPKPGQMPADGTYELVGPHIQGGVESDFAVEQCVNHRSPLLWLDNPPDRTFGGIQSWFDGKDIEGIVFHHPDGRMAKIKLRDFGLKRAPPQSPAGSP